MSQADTPLIDALPDLWAVMERETAALRELDLCRRLRRVIERRDRFRRADAMREADAGDRAALQARQEGSHAD